jgi:hypothetical protein
MGLRKRAGAAVLRSDPDECVLGNAGWLGTPKIVGLTSPAQVVLATLIGFTGQALRAAAAPVHRAVARYCLSAPASLTPERT